MTKTLYEGSITQVKGIRVGQAENCEAMTGVTVILADGEGAVVAADVRGAAPGTRETDLCKPENTVEKANAVVLSGGSAYGLAAATGVMEYLEKQGLGVDMGFVRVPIVPSAVVFDLGVGSPFIRPDAQMGITACESASDTVLQGSHGAGTGATVGKMIPHSIPSKGGVGTASLTLECGITVGAIAVVNACGDVYDPTTNELLACGHMPDGSPVKVNDLLCGLSPLQGMTGGNTTICVVATDALLTKAQAQRLATCAHDGYARSIRPVHTQMDGDTVFALATGRVNASVEPVRLCAAAAEVTARAIANAILAEESA